MGLRESAKSNSFRRPALRELLEPVAGPTVPVEHGDHVECFVADGVDQLEWEALEA